MTTSERTPLSKKIANFFFQIFKKIKDFGNAVKSFFSLSRTEPSKAQSLSLEEQDSTPAQPKQAAPTSSDLRFTQIPGRKDADLIKDASEPDLPTSTKPVVPAPTSPKATKSAESARGAAAPQNKETQMLRMKRHIKMKTEDLMRWEPTQAQKDKIHGSFNTLKDHLNALQEIRLEIRARLKEEYAGLLKEVDEAIADYTNTSLKTASDIDKEDFDNIKAVVEHIRKEAQTLMSTDDYIQTIKKMRIKVDQLNYLKSPAEDDVGDNNDEWDKFLDEPQPRWPLVLAPLVHAKPVMMQEIAIKRVDALAQSINLRLGKASYSLQGYSKDSRAYNEDLKIDEMLQEVVDIYTESKATLEHGSDTDIGHLEAKFSRADKLLGYIETEIKLQDRKQQFLSSLTKGTFSAANSAYYAVTKHKDPDKGTADKVIEALKAAACLPSTEIVAQVGQDIRTIEYVFHPKIKAQYDDLVEAFLTYHVSNKTAARCSPEDLKLKIGALNQAVAQINQELGLVELTPPFVLSKPKNK